MELKLTGHLADTLAHEARRRGVSVETLLAFLMANGMDGRERIAFYTRLHGSLLDEAEEHYRAGELVQAGEKLWGAVCALLNAIGELKGLPHYSHRDYVDIIEALVQETGAGSSPGSSPALGGSTRTSTMPSSPGPRSRRTGRMP